MMRVLLLEDSHNLATAVIAALSNIGIDVVLATSVQEARDKYEPDTFDVMLCDFELPDGTGLDFLAGIRGSDKAVTILWSGLNRQADIDASGLHIDHVFTKERLPEVMALVASLGS